MVVSRSGSRVVVYGRRTLVSTHLLSALPLQVGLADVLCRELPGMLKLAEEAPSILFDSSLWQDLAE